MRNQKVEYDTESCSCESSLALKGVAAAKPISVVAGRLSYRSDLMREP
jgi:hypothetical protein